MGERGAVADKDGLIEGDPLTCDQLAAVVAWNDVHRPPLLRIHPAFREGTKRIAVIAWATSALARGRRLAAMRADDPAWG